MLLGMMLLVVYFLVSVGFLEHDVDKVDEGSICL